MVNTNIEHKSITYIPPTSLDHYNEMLPKLGYEIVNVTKGDFYFDMHLKRDKSKVSQEILDITDKFIELSRYNRVWIKPYWYDWKIMFLGSIGIFIAFFIIMEIYFPDLKADSDIITIPLFLLCVWLFIFYRLLKIKKENDNKKNKQAELQKLDDIVKKFS